MDNKLRAWLNSLSPEERKIAVEKLGAIAVEAAKDKFLEAARKAAGLPPELDEDPNEDKVAAAARKAARLP